jgi:hypothetical protein
VARRTLKSPITQSQGANMNWYYESGGQQQGPVTDADLDRLLAEGKITVDTLVWREGMSGWTPLRSARPAAAPAPGIAPVPSSTPSAPIPAATPSATAGSDVPQPGWIRCSLTGRFFPPSEIIYLEGKPYSAAAKPQVVATLQSGGVLPTTGSAGDWIGPAWEQRQQLGIWKAIVDTVKAVLTLPAHTFATMRRNGGIASPLLFWLITAGVGMAVGQVYSLLLQGVMYGAMSSTGGANAQQAAAMFGMNSAFGGASIIVMPIAFLIALFAQAGLTHLTLMMFKGANQSFETTFRVLAYAFGATGTLHLIPICGSMIAGLWGLIVVCMGLAPAHNTTTGKGVAATLIPVGVCCLGIIGVYAVIIGGVVAATSAARGGR